MNGSKMADNTTAAAAVMYSRFWEQVHSGFLIIVIIAALLGNGFVCIAVYRVRRLQKVSNYFLVSLAVSDILVVLLAIPFRIYFELNMVWELGADACKFWIFMDLLCSGSSIFNLSLISVDRYVALSQSLRYLAIATVARCRMGIAAVWGFSFIVAAFSLHSWSPGARFASYPACFKQDKMYYTFSTICGIIIPLVLLIVLYCLVFRIALRQRQKILRNDYNNSSLSSSQDGIELTTARVKPRRFAIRELKATKTLIIVVGAFLVCWLPLFFLLIIMQYAPDYIMNLPAKTQEILGQLFMYSLPQFNSCLNPYIYASHNAEFRAVFKYMIAKMFPFLKVKSKAELQRRLATVETDFASADL